MANKTVSVTGEVVFSKVTKPFKNVRVYVRLEDVSRQDVPSTLIAEQVIENVKVTAEAIRTNALPRVEFRLQGRIPDLRGMYIVTAHVDVDGDGMTGLGDYLTQEYYPVLTHGNPKHCTVYVKEIV